MRCLIVIWLDLATAASAIVLRQPADHIIANVPDVLKAIREDLEVPLNATRDEQSSGYAAAIGYGINSVARAFEDEVRYVWGAPMIKDRDEGKLVLYETTKVAMKMISNANLLTDLIPLFHRELPDLYDRMVDLNHWDSMYFQWIAYHSETDFENQQEIWLATMKAIKPAVEKAKDLKESTDSVTADQTQPRLEF